MNKIISSIAILAACATFAVAAPRSSTKVVNWADVSAKVAEIQAVVTNTFDQATSTANNENELVGSNIALKIDVAIVGAAVVLDQANAAIADQTLTVEQARSLTGSLKGVVGTLVGAIQDDLALLLPVTAVQIRVLFGTAFDSIDLRADELYLLLSQ